MIYIRKSNERGKSQYDWLQSFHTFSFANYYDPGFMGFGSLRVINEDTVQAGQGFPKHAHDNMEIISYVVEGELAHEDSMGTGSVIKPGEIQRMTAGAGVQHSEYNHSKTNSLHFLQIWIIPEAQGLKPSYEQKVITPEKNKLILIGSRDGQDGSVIIHQDVQLYVAYLSPKHMIHYPLKEKRGVWIQLIKGILQLNDHVLSAGDGVAVFDESDITLTANKDAEFLLFDLQIVQ